MELLRQKCVPALVFLLVRVLNFSGEEVQCLRIADLVACERYQLYKVRSRSPEVANRARNEEITHMGAFFG